MTSTESMVEKVAQTIYAIVPVFEITVMSDEWTLDDVSWDSAPEYSRNKARDLACAAIREIAREPYPENVEEHMGQLVANGETNWRDLVSGFLNAALEEKNGHEKTR